MSTTRSKDQVNKKKVSKATPIPAKARNQTSKLKLSSKKNVIIPKSQKAGIVNRLARGLGESVGGLLGSSTLKNSLGDAGSYIAKVMGFGDYKIASNTLLTNQQVPSFSSNGETVIVKHREYMFDLSSSVGFVNNKFLINPGNRIVFPWLSSVAANFESYRILGMVFEYKTTSGEALNSVNTALGTVTFACDYDALDSQYDSKRDMENTEYWTACAPFESMLHPLECAPSSNQILNYNVTNVNSVTAVSGDPRLYFPASLQIATSGMQNANVIGEVWCSYQIELMKPQMPPASTLDPPRWAAQFSNYNTVTAYSADTAFYNPTVTFLTPGYTTSKMKIEFPASMWGGSYHLIAVGAALLSSVTLYSNADPTVSASNLQFYGGPDPGALPGAANALYTASAAGAWSYINSTTSNYGPYSLAYSTTNSHQFSCKFKVLNPGIVGGLPYIQFPLQAFTGASAQYKVFLLPTGTNLFGTQVTPYSVTDDGEVLIPDHPIIPRVIDTDAFDSERLKEERKKQELIRLIQGIVNKHDYDEGIDIGTRVIRPSKQEETDEASSSDTPPSSPVLVPRSRKNQR